jgi:hypothetical protein
MAIDPKNPTNEFDRSAPNFPQDPQAVKVFEKEIDLGNFGEVIIPPIFAVPRYLVTYMNSQTRNKIRSATVVSVTNQAKQPNRVVVSYYWGLGNSVAGSSAFSIPPGWTIDFCTRNLPGEITTCNSVPKPELTFNEGRAIVSSTLSGIAVSARVYYTSGKGDEELLAITDSKIVNFGEGNNGD